MSIENAVRNRSLLVERLGKAALNMRYPKEFEYYVCAFELIDGGGNTLNYFIFPVMPSGIDESQPKLTNIKKTMGGVVAISNTTFTPVDISLSGNFGRKFKIMLGANFTDFISSFKSPNKTVTKESFAKGIYEIFDKRVKTGYGCLKVLEEIINEADKIDSKGPRRLIFYNLAFGNSYIVKPMSFKISMSQDINMIHGYSLTMKGIAPLEAVYSAKDLSKKERELSLAAISQKPIARTVNQLTSLLKF